MDLQPDQELQKQIPTPNIAIVGLLLAVFLAPVGFIVSIVAWRRIRKHSLPGKKLAITGTVLGALLSLPEILLLAWILIGYGAWHGNQAQKDLKPIAKQVLAIGGVKLCDNGDGGYGLDNTQPWYQVYYIVPNKPDLTNTIQSIASRQGYKLGPNTEFIKQLKGQPGPNGGYSRPYGGEQFNPKSDYLVGRNGGQLLVVTINRQASVPLYCGVRDYGKEQQTGDKAIIDFDLTLPDRSE